MIGRKSYLLLVGTMLSALANFIGVYFLTNYLGPSEYGTLVWAIAIMTSLNVVADLGFDSAHIKRTSEGKDQSDRLATYMLVKVILMAIMIVIVASFLLLWPHLSSDTITEGTTSLLIIFTVYFIFFDLATIFTCTFMAREEVARYALIILADPVVRVPLTVYLAVNHASLTEVGLAYVCGSLTMLVMALVVFFRSGLKIGRPNRFKEYFSFAIPISTIAVIITLSTNLDKVFIGLFASKEAVGFYTSAFTLMLMVSAIGSAVANVTFPVFSRLITEGRKDTIRESTYAAERLIALLVAPVIAFCMVFPELILTTLFGSGFAEAAPALQLLAFAFYINMLNGIYFSQIYSFNLPKTAAKINITWFALDIVLVLVLVPSSYLGLSLVGAAIAYTVSVGLSSALTRLVTGKLSGSIMNIKIIPITLTAAAAAASILFLQHILPLSGLWGVLVYAPSLLLVYFVLVYGTRLLSKGDIDYLLDVVNPLKLISYVRSEVKK